jgi:hypothetical protein
MRYFRSCTVALIESACAPRRTVSITTSPVRVPELEG